VIFWSKMQQFLHIGDAEELLPFFLKVMDDFGPMD
jgi:hypothetical protein